MQSKHLDIILACLIGIAAGLSAVLVKAGINYLGTSRIDMTMVYSSIVVLPLLGLIGGLIAGAFTKYIAPEINGSGIPQVKAYLSGYPMAMNLRVAAAKLVAGVIAIGSGIPLGREGPTVQIGACMAKEVGHWLKVKSTNSRELLAAGAGAGLAAAFNAPIAGVIFVIEELFKKVSSATVVTAALASIVASLISQHFATHDVRLAHGVIPDQVSVTFAEIPLFVLLGIGAGLIGAAINLGIIECTKFSTKSKIDIVWRVGLAGLIIGVVTALAPIQFHDYAGLTECFTHGEATWQLALLALAIRPALMVIAYGSGCPGGIFSPALTIGSSLGFLVGILAQTYAIGQPEIFALAGMGAVFTAVARVPLTAIIIVFEMTQNFSLILPLMLSSIVAYVVAERLYPGSVYDRLLRLQGIDVEAQEAQ